MEEVLVDERLPIADIRVFDNGTIRLATRRSVTAEEAGWLAALAQGALVAGRHYRNGGAAEEPALVEPAPHPGARRRNPGPAGPQSSRRPKPTRPDPGRTDRDG